MKTARIPGFTAESSLNASGKSYRSSCLLTSKSNSGGVRPQVTICDSDRCYTVDCPPWSDFCNVTVYHVPTDM